MLYTSEQYKAKSRIFRVIPVDLDKDVKAQRRKQHTKWKRQGLNLEQAFKGGKC